MTTASLIVDIYNIRCSNCKVTVEDQLTLRCPACGAIIDRIVSNHVGLSRKLTKSRIDAGIGFLTNHLESNSDRSNGKQVTAATLPTVVEILNASLIVDFSKVRCGGCKIAIQDDLTDECPVCGATFDRIVSNHVGLAEKLKHRRNEANGQLDGKSDSKAASPEDITS